MSKKSVLTEKSLGILLHPTSLPGESVCGTFGESAKSWIEKLSKHDITFWQFLPLTPTDETGSPYSAPSSFALNPWFLDHKELIKNNYIYKPDKEDLTPIKHEKNYFNFNSADKSSQKSEEYLLNSWEDQSEERKIDFMEWTRQNPWVEDYSLFMVIRKEFNMLPWWQWPKDFKQKNMQFLNKWINKHAKAVLAKKLIQWHLDKQWKEIKSFAKSKKIKLIGDLPFYVSRDSVDVWSNKSLFSVSNNGDLIFQSGVPPDYFSSTGQLWGTPTYFWSKHQRTKFEWWRKRFQRQFELVDILRLDHFRALAGYWRVQGNAETAINGKWINSPGRKLLSLLKKDLKSEFLPIIAEDLGVITPDVEKLREDFVLPGMKILQFAFDGNSDNPYLPNNIDGSNWVVYTGTHDNPTSYSWWKCLEDNVKEKIIDNYKFSNDPSWNLIEIGMHTKANLFISPIQDILSLDNSSRMNTPGTTTNNWNWRLNYSLEKIDSKLQTYSMLGKNYGRTNKSFF